MNLFAIKYANMLSMLILFIAHSTIIQGSHAIDDVQTPFHNPSDVVIGELQPLLEATTEYRVAVELLTEGNTARRRRLAPFQLCLECRCCISAADPTTCTNVPCCFGIDCQLPNKPFGVCAFVPKTCNCASCAV